jgi:hypothetical protein
MPTFTDSQLLDKMIADSVEYDDFGHPFTEFGRNHHFDGLTVADMLYYQKKAVEGGGTPGPSPSGGTEDYIESTDTVGGGGKPDYPDVTGEGEPTGVTDNGVRETDMSSNTYDDFDNIING